MHALSPINPREDMPATSSTATRDNRVTPVCRLEDVARPEGRFMARLRATSTAFRVTVMVLGLAIAFSHNFVHMPPGLHYALYFIGLTMFLVFWGVSRPRRS